jgi:hypothetical protein
LNQKEALAEAWRPEHGEDRAGRIAQHRKLVGAVSVEAILPPQFVEADYTMTDHSFAAPKFYRERQMKETKQKKWWFEIKECSSAQK